MILPPLTPDEHRAANLGAHMAAEGFNDSDCPYKPGDQHDAWHRGFNWCHRLVGNAVR